ncbi:MAG TPA: ABC transporter ATP-binding protein [Candidatus Binatia bacterium]|nr:ABC transporter ATP-binding protein [Candidatus Binatia bacterium]
MIRFVRLQKRYGPTVAVAELDFAIEEGAVFGFIGPNGAGKTTTIRMMVGILAPTSGTVVVGGHDIAREPEAAKAITGYLPDHPFLYDKLTALELLRFVGGLYGLSGHALERRAAELLEQFLLAERAGELTETFSHGMKQRLALAAALIHRPRILILDEPMVGLDPQGAVALRRLLVELSGQGVTIFLSTHSLNVAEALCDRFGVLDRGRLIALGSLADLRARAAAGADGRAANGADGSLEDVFLTITGAA